MTQASTTADLRPVAPEVAPVAILIVAYKSRETIPAVIAALECQTVRPARVRILENGSPADSRVNPDDVPDWIELVVSETNTGFAGGNNLLAKGIEEDWLLLLNPDAFPEPDWLEEFMAATERWPEASLFGCTQLTHGMPGVLDGAGDVYHVTGLPYRASYGMRHEPPEDGYVFGPCGASAMIKRSVFEALEGFDEDYFCYVEDVDLAYRARLMGELSVQVRDARVSHMGYASSGRRSSFATYHGVRNRLWTFFKNTPGWAVWALAPLHMSVTLLHWLSSARFGLFTTFGRAVRDAFSDWPRLMDKRRAVQRARRVTTAEILRAMTWSVSALVSRRADVRPRPPNDSSKS